MKNFSNLHVMSLKGVCLDGGPVPYIVLPYMANGSLAAYLKKERKNLVMTKDKICSDEDELQSQDLVSLCFNNCMHNITRIKSDYCDSVVGSCSLSFHALCIST